MNITLTRRQANDADLSILFKAGGNYKTVREAFKAARDSVKG